MTDKSNCIRVTGTKENLGITKVSFVFGELLNLKTFSLTEGGSYLDITSATRD